MRKGWILFVVALILFVGIRFVPLLRHKEESLSHLKPIVPVGCNTILSHPWLREQNVTTLTEEMRSDIQELTELTAALAANQGRSEEEVYNDLHDKLVALQAEIPLALPLLGYNVFCIHEYPTDSPYPFHVYKRLCIGRSDLGFPIYLDVRVFACDSDAMRDAIISYHLHMLDEGPQAFVGQGEGYLGHGHRVHYVPSHGFAPLLSERGVYLQFCHTGDRLYVAYADAPWATLSALFNK